MSTLLAALARWVTPKQNPTPPVLRTPVTIRRSIADHRGAGPAPPPRATSVRATRAAEAVLEEQKHKPDDLHSAPPPQEPELTPADVDYVLHMPVHEIDPRDKDTPDHWVARNPALIRLTGNQPFNAGPPAAELMEHFITPSSLHYVRQHGLVPHLNWQDHKVVIDGMVSRPLHLTMDHLRALPQHTIVSSMACARVRRKELNVIKKTQGYAGGPQAISTGVWTGVLLRDVLELAGVHSWKQGARWVHVGGPKGEVSAGDTTYTTSLPYHQSVDAGCEVMLAYMHNGRLLHPDHGFPVRLIVPGNIGGRSVKWLSSIHVSDKDTDNYYHLHDNRFFPPGIEDQAQAEAEGMLTRPDLACREQNINSSIMHPAHGTEVQTEGEATFKGYALSGGGRQVTRVELSIDKGATWNVATIDQRAPPSITDGAEKHWAWVMWKWTVPWEKIAKEGAEIRVRAVDTAMNTQPEKPMWNLIGMMNNGQYSIQVRRMETPKAEGEGNGKAGGKGGARLLMLHPAPVDPTDVPGWMEIDQQKHFAESGDPLMRTEMESEEAQGKGWDKLKEIDMKEVERHTSEETGVWFVKDGKVYDATPFINEHPGGRHIILGNAGKDASDAFNSIHSADARRLITKYLIGRLKGAEDPYTAVRKAVASGAPSPGQDENVALSPLEARPFKLEKKESISHDTRRFRFALSKPDQQLGLPVGQHVQLVAEIDGQQVGRPYTPVTLESEHKPYFELVVKVYPPHDNIPGGKMSMYLDGLKEGDSLSIRGPTGLVHYLGQGRMHWKPRGAGAKEEHVTQINLIGGGTGITPLYQIAKAVLSDPEDRTQIRLIYANKTENDILLREDLEAFGKDPRCKVYFVVDHAPPNWPGGEGHISQDMLKEQGFAPAPGVVSMVCGPPPMIEKGVKPALVALGFASTHIIDFDEGHR